MEPMDKPALIIIDMQKGMATPQAGPRNNPQAEANIALLLQAWRDRAWPIVHVRHMSRAPGSLFWPGQVNNEFQPALAPLPHEQVVEKKIPCAFTNNMLDGWLRERRITQLVIAGVSTNNSVEATARTAGNLGFAVRVVSDACFAFDKVDYAGTPRSAAEVHAMSLANLDGEYASISSSDKVLDQL